MDRTGKSCISGFLGVPEMKAPISALTVKLLPGDCLFLYTDCLVESQNSQGRQYQETGIMGSLKNIPDGTAREMLGYIIRDFDEFLEGKPIRDDLTAILIKMK
jgi:serine phosphatase RsbU (regulator of sigma subunit)